MRKNLLKLFALLAIMFVPFALFAQEYGSILNESFENGIPEEWTQENVSGSMNWSVESGTLTRPSNAFDGTKRVAFRNTNGVTSMAKTRLISPVFDAKSLYQPILIFAHAQDKWTDDFDVLKVLYRTAPEKDWVELKVFDKCITKWQIDTLRLIGATATYQIAFEATDNLGRGVVLDDVEVRSTPNCIKPYNLTLSNVSNDSITLGWLGAFDAVSFDIKVDTVALTAEQLVEPTYKAKVCDVTVSNVWNYTVKGLKPGTKYFYYIRSNCFDESSEWVASEFSTSNFLNLPYVENFNYPTTPGFVSFPKNWYLFASSGLVTPYINTNYTSTAYWYFSTHGNEQSYALCFTGEYKNNARDGIPGGAYSYAVLPQVTANVSDLEVTLTTTCSYFIDADRFSIIVGVMTDPTSKASFVAVDTINVDKIRTYEEFTVSFENYEGNGKYIAFMSDFVESNRFLIDDLKVDYRPEVSKVRFDVKVPSATSIKLDFNKAYDKYEVVVAKSELNIANIDNSQIILQKEVTNLEEITGLPSATDLYIYARGKKGTAVGEWNSYPTCVRMPAKMGAYPHVIDFEYSTNDSSTFYNPHVGNRLSTYKLDPEVTYLSNYVDAIPQNSNTNKTATIPQRTNYEMSMSFNLEYTPAYITAIFPEMENPKNTRVGFYTVRRSSPSAYYVGLMSDANDITTFQVIDTVVPEMRYTYYVYDLNKYNAEGKFFAVLLDAKYNFPDLDPTALNYVYCYLDDVKFSTIPSCDSPTNIKIDSDLTNPSKVKFSWDANGATSWKVRIAETDYDMETLDATNDNVYIYDTVVTTNSLQCENLVFPGKRYYYWIKSSCGDTEGEWTVTNYFDTECYAQWPIPYVQDFDKDEYVASSAEKTFQVPCMATTLVAYVSGGTGASTSYYPHIAANSGTTTIYAASGTKALRFSKPSASIVDKKLYVALPKMAEPVNKLQLSVKLKAFSANQALLVGVMTNPYDSTTIEPVTVIKPKIGEYLEYIISFADYKGNGEYIALASDYTFTSTDSYGLCIDDIVVDYISDCARPENLKLADIGNTTATIQWDATTATSWRVLVATEELTLDELNNPQVGDKVVVLDTVNVNPYEITDLLGNTPFVVYVQTLCSSTDKSAWSNPLKIRTTCELLDTYEMGVENFDNYGTGNGKFPPCYIVGNKTAGAGAAYIPSCNTSYKHSGGASLKFQTTTSYNGAYAIAPRIDISDIRMIRVKFWGSVGSNSYATDKYAHALIVGVLTDPTDIATFVPTDTVDLALEGRAFEVNFKNYKHDLNGDTGKYVMFYSAFDKANYAYIDDVEFDTLYACSGNMEVDAITQNSISVSFDSEATEYQIKYATSLCDAAQLNIDSLPVVDVTGKTATITGLLDATNYYLYARAKCDGVYSEWSTVKVVSTDCLDKVALPYSDDFEKNLITGAGAAPLCWNTYYATNTDYPQVSTTAASGTRGVYIYTSSSAASYLVSNELIVDNLGKCQVSFNARPSAANKNRAIIIGAVSHIDSIATTFEPIDTLIINFATTVYEKQVVLLDKYTGTAKHLAFTTDYTASDKAAGGYYLDDVIIELIPSCAKPDYFEFKGKTDKTLAFSFVHDGAQKYEVKYGAKDFNVDTEGATMECTTTEFTISALTAETEYDVYVRAICSDVESSPWSYAGSYTTTSEPIASFPYTFTFEDEDEAAKWRFVQADQPNTWCIGMDADSIVADQKNSTDKALYISKDGGATANYRDAVNEQSIAATSYSWAYRTIYLEPGVYTISYDWTCYGEFSSSPSDYARVGLLPAASTMAADGKNKIANYDGTSTNLTYSTTPVDWFNLSEHAVSGTSNYYRLCGIDTTKALDEQWKTLTETIVITEELAGTYNMVFYWYNNNATSTGSSYSGYYTKRGAAIDNLSIEKHACNKPVDLKLGLYDYETAEFSWSDLTVAPTAYNVKVVLAGVDPDAASAEQTAFAQQVTAKYAKATGLADNTAYDVYVQAVCSDENSSIWSDALSFTTVCAPHAIDTVFNFDSEEGYYLPPYVAAGTNVNTKYKIPNCFEITHGKGLEFKYASSNAPASFFPYLEKTSGTTQYSYSGNYALKFAYTDSTKSGGTIALPLIDGDMEELQVSFMMRAIHHNNSTNKLVVTGIGSAYARKITVGTMTDPRDPSTFVALDTIEYPYPYNSLKSSNLVTEDASGNNYWVEAVVSLAGATGKYVAFRNEVYDGKKSNQMYIDNVVISSAISCIAPTDVTVDALTSTSVVVNCKHEGTAQYVVQTALDGDFSVGLKSDTVSSLPYEMKGLTPATAYYLRVQSMCAEDDFSKWSVISEFTTASVIAFNQGFSNTSYCPDGWERGYSASAEDVFNNNAPISMLAHTATGSTWRTRSNGLFETGMFSTGRMSASVLSDNKGWLFSPCIELANTAKQHLVFDLALTSSVDNSALSDEDKAATDDKFMVIISEDHGKTWKRENAIVWGHGAPDEKHFFSIPSTGEQVVIDLAKYAGKVIKVAFYVESKTSDAKVAIHLDNVHINTYVETVMSGAICQTEDYEDEVFYITSTDLKVGENVSNELYLATKQKEEDVYYSLSVNVTPMIETNLEASICEGDVYAKYNFSGLMEAGVYKQKHRATNGCDSVVTLTLSLIPASKVIIFDTICYGTSVIWNGEEFGKTGVYVDTLVSQVTGCDSIVTLVLKVNDAIRLDKYVNICFGDTYTFGSQVISTSGNYEETFETATGCDSIVMLHATVLPDYRKTINAVIKYGQSYSDNGFVGLTEQDTYTLPLISVDGCDSTIVLNLTVLSADTTYVTNEITTNDLPFEYETLYYDENTQPGTYVDTLVIDNEDGSKYVIIHTLIVHLYDAVDNISIKDLIMYPNPVAINSTLSVVAEFTSEERDGLFVEVFNAIGQRVYVDSPIVYPIQISGLIERGVYLVRITTGNGDLYQGKVVVK